MRSRYIAHTPDKLTGPFDGSSWLGYCVADRLSLLHRRALSHSLEFEFKSFRLLLTLTYALKGERRREAGVLGARPDSGGSGAVCGRASGSGGAGEFGEVVRDAEERPFRLDVLDAAQQELSKASGLLDLAKDRLDDLLAQSVTAAPSRPL